MADPNIDTNLTFPPQLATYTYWMTFRFYSYNIPPVPGFGAPNAVLQQLSVMRLPLPNSMIDHQDIVFSVEDMGLIAGSALARLQQIPNGTAGQQAAALAAGGLLGAGATAGVNIGNRGLPGGNAGGGNIILQTQGVAVNPFLSVMFKSPAFKKHAFKWKLSPVNQNESVIMNNIINTFRYNQLPALSSAFGGTMLSYPNIVQVSVSVASTPSNWQGSNFTYAFKPAVLESFAVNFTPSGQPSFFGTTSAPTETEISVSLLEVEYWLRDSWAQGPGATGGQSVENLLNSLNGLIPSSSPVSSNPALDGLATVGGAG